MRRRAAALRVAEPEKPFNIKAYPYAKLCTSLGLWRDQSWIIVSRQALPWGRKDSGNYAFHTVRLLPKT